MLLAGDRDDDFVEAPDIIGARRLAAQAPVAIRPELCARIKLKDELRAAIPGGQLFLVYQPQVLANSGRITGVEALVRWHHPERGVLSPKCFLPTAESSGLIVALGEWVLREACHQARAWIDEGYPADTMCVNLSPLQLEDPITFENPVQTTLQETQLPGHLLELEITETALINFTPDHMSVIQRLRAAGVRFSLDDFGTGNSSLHYLQQDPVDRIKVAREFSRAPFQTQIAFRVDLCARLGARYRQQDHSRGGRNP